MNTTLQLLTNAATFIFVASLKGSALIVLVLMAQKLLERVLPAHWRYALWFTVVVALVTPVGFEAALLPATRSVELPTSQPAPALSSLRPINASESTTTPDASAPTVFVRAESPTSWSGGVLLPYAWLAGLLSVCSAIALSTMRFGRLVRNARPASGAARALLQDCLKLTACRRAVAVVESAGVDAPMIAGLFKPVLLLPPHLERQLTGAQLRHVFIHELMHLQRGDIAGNWIVATVQALHWFNPLVWYAFFRMRQDRELACDAATLRHLVPGERSAYGQTLLQLNDMLQRTTMPAIALGILGSGSLLHNRIGLLASGSHQRKSQAFVAATLLVMFAAAAFSQPVRMPAATPAVANVDPSRVAAPTPPPANDVETAAVTTPEEPSPTVVVLERPEPVTRPIVQAEPEREAMRDIVADSIESPLLAQVETRPADVLPAPERVVVAALSALPPEATTSEPAPGLMQAIEDMAAEIDAFNAGKPALIAEWDALATACRARKDDSPFGLLSKPCREVRVVQIRGDVFRFAYACHVLGLQHAAQWSAYEEATAQQRTRLDGAEDALLANAQQLNAVCNEANYVTQYPGFSTMLADAVALKYYNPWQRIPSMNVVSVSAASYVYGAYTDAGNQVPYPVQ